MSRKRLALAAAAVTLIGGGTFVGDACLCLTPGPQPQSPGGGTDQTANIWVDTDGGTCVDNASPVVYDTATACGTFDAANDTCDNGDQVAVQGGSYPDQTISGANSRSAACTFVVATGETVDMGSADSGVTGGKLTVCSDWLTFEGTTSRADALAATAVDPDGVRDGFDIFNVDMTLCTSPSIFQSSNVILRNLSLGRVSWTGSRDNQIVGGQIGPLDCGANVNEDMLTMKSRINQSDGNDYPLTDVVVDGVVFHDSIRPGGCTNHMDMIQVFSGDGVTIKNNLFLRADDQMLFGRCELECGADAPLRDWVIENNLFSSCCQASSSSETLSLDGSGAIPCVNMVVRYNTMRDRAPKLRCTDASSGSDGPASDIQAYGNLFYSKATDCTLATWTHNFYWNTATAGCGGTGETVWNGSGSVMTDPGNDDFTLTAGSSAKTEGHPTLCPSLDFEGETRPQPGATSCDAGADEEA